MLVQFMLKNVLSFKQETNNLIPLGDNEKLLKVAAVYGANASGKSNLYTAMLLFQRIIRESFNKDEENSEFQIIEIVNDFEYNDEYIVSEWMYRKNLKTNRTSMIMERSRDAIKFGASVRKECDLYKQQIPGETLALSFFNKLKLKTGIFAEYWQMTWDLEKQNLLELMWES